MKRKRCATPAFRSKKNWPSDGDSQKKGEFVTFENNRGPGACYLPATTLTRTSLRNFPPFAIGNEHRNLGFIASN
jgi:hypothetical protein